MRRPLAGLFYILLGLPFALSSLLALSARPWILDREFYRKAVTDERLYAVLRSPEARRGIDEKIVIGGYIFSGPGLAAALQKNLPEAEIKATATGAIDATLDLVGSGNARGAKIDLRPLKEGLKKKTPALAADYFATLPSSPVALPPGDLSSRPIEAVPATLQKAATKAFDAAIETLPDNYDISAPQPGRRLNGQLVFGQAALDSFAWLGSGFSALLCLGLGFLGGGGFGRSLARAGRMMMLPSVVVLGMGVALSLPGAPLIQLLPPEAVTAVGTGFIEAARGWAATVLGGAARSFFVVGLVGVSVGGLIASLKRLFEHRES